MGHPLRKKIPFFCQYSMCLQGPVYVRTFIKTAFKSSSLYFLKIQASVNWITLEKDQAT